MKILLAVDGSTASDRAIELVATTDWPVGSHVQLTNVADALLGFYAGMPAVVVSTEALEADIALDRERRQQFLDAAAARVAAPGRTVTTEIIGGRPASAIVEAARAARADLIVLGSHGRGAVGAAILGSVAAEVVEYATTPVLVARTAGVSRLTLADDGSPSATAARALVGRMPGFGGLPCRVVSVSERQPGWFGWLQPEAAGEIQALEEAIEADLRGHEARAAASADELSRAGLVAESVAPVGDPAPEIVRSAEAFHADLIVMGTRGQTGFERLLLGSVARKVLERAHCSVLVIRPRAQ